MKIAVTGASGFVGRPLCNELLARGYAVRALVREKNTHTERPVDATDVATIGDIGSLTDWSNALSGIDSVIHCAGRAHVMNETSGNALQAYREVNVIGTRRLAEQAAASGAKRFIYLSSIKVNGESTSPGRFYTALDLPNPEDAYGQSKYEAEIALREVASSTGLEVVVIRPPLIYGPGVKGNLARLFGLVKRGIPLPLGLVHNARSLVGIDNLVDLIVVCLNHPAAVGETFLVSDGKDLSTQDLLRCMAASIHRAARLWPVPIPFLQLAGKLTGRSGEIDRLIGSLQVDISRTCHVLNWSPPFTAEDCLRRMVASEVDTRV